MVRKDHARVAVDGERQGNVEVHVIQPPVIGLREGIGVRQVIRHRYRETSRNAEKKVDESINIVNGHADRDKKMQVGKQVIR